MKCRGHVKKAILIVGKSVKTAFLVISEITKLTSEGFDVLAMCVDEGAKNIVDHINEKEREDAINSFKWSKDTLDESLSPIGEEERVFNNLRQSAKKNVNTKEKSNIDDWTLDESSNLFDKLGESVKNDSNIEKNHSTEDLYANKESNLEKEPSFEDYVLGNTDENINSILW